jgi:hypothetical protein
MRIDPFSQPVGADGKRKNEAVPGRARRGRRKSLAKPAVPG